MQTTIATKQGKVEGFLSGGAVVFRGIPYAAPPVGELRFRRPQEHEPWDGVLDCKKFGCSCPQADLSGLDLYGKEFYDQPMPAHSEDCLYLNVWTPESAGPGDKLPVMFWIHGGAFMHGSGSEKEFDGEDMAQRGVILVTINYRVNAFGFFAHPELEKENEEHVSGNYGILDQIAALKWVRENIAAFGGDPENITIFGQSAGCMSVQTIISSNLSKGMFKRAILQSGGGLHGLHETPSRGQAQESGKKLMEHLGVSTIAELRKVPAEKLRDAAYAVSGQNLSWTPHVDGWLLEGTTDDLALEGKIHDIEYMIGSLADDIGGDDLLQRAGAEFCENQLKLGRAPAYMYYFTRKLPGDNAGAFHSAELWYVFNTLSHCWRPWEDRDRQLADRVAGYWTNFAKTGDPNAPGLPRWEPYTGEGCKCILD